MDRTPTLQLPRITHVLALGRLELLPEQIYSPDQDTVGPAETLYDFVLATSTSYTRGIVGVLFEHDAPLIVFEAFHARELGRRAACRAPRAERRVEVSLCEAKSEVLRPDVISVSTRVRIERRVEQALHDDVL